MKPLRWWLLLLVLASSSIHAAPEFWLVTYGPGPAVWERFGHNALWLRDRATGENALYNYGFFDFEQPGFVPRFIRGRMLYYAAATDPEREFPFYRQRQRSISVQKLNLSEAQAQALAGNLRRSVLPGEREYLYDYFLANCSTRVRDALDEVLGGAIERSQAGELTATSFRRSALTQVQDDFWLYLGIQLGLGRPADQQLSEWQRFYLPHALSEQLAEITSEQGVVASPAQELQPGMPLMAELRPYYGQFAALGGVSLMMILLPWWRLRERRPRLAILPARLWLLLGGLAGGLLAFLWLGTDHSAAWRNENLLLLNPLALILAVFPGWRYARTLGGLLAAALLIAVVFKLFPGSQFNHDLLLWLLPAQAAALWVTWARN
ncbi:MAG: DUF4105 domain-containing protein [Wenzhouxiangellaceae bacterium]